MSKRFATHNRFAAEDSRPSRLEELTQDRRLVERERHRSGWLRNLMALGALIVIGLVVRMLAQ
jgi:hypothetical protein